MHPFCIEEASYEYVVELVHRKKHDCEQISTNTNIFIAIFTTAHAHIKLYRAHDRLQEQILYFNTDSVIYKWKSALPEVEFGDYLGDCMNELDLRRLHQSVGIDWPRELWVRNKER